MSARRSSAPLRQLPDWVRLGGAALLALLAFSVTFSLQLPEQGATYLLLFPAVLGAAYLAGRDAGFAATATAAVLVAARIVAEWHSEMHLLTQVASLILFVAIGAGTAILFSRLKQAMRDLEESNAQLIEAGEEAETAREETDLLLRELRHRVRNDLANIIAVLRLQARSAEGEAATSLQAAADRLQVLAKVHQRLSREGHSPVVEMKGFLEDLCRELRTTLLPLKPVALETEIDEISLPSTRAVAVGLIVNELLTNAIKYGYPDDREGTICVYLTCGEELVEVRVEDDGVGNPADRPAEEGSGLGHRLVRSLAAQLGGRFTCDANPPGLTCAVAFPAEQPRREPRREALA